MSSEVYIELREQLDQYSCGFPTTQSGVEFKILEKLFTEEEAQMFLSLSIKAEAPEEVAKRLSRDPAEVASILHRMSVKGLIFCLRRGEANSYAAIPFMLGIYEYQLGRMDRDLASLCNQYFEESFLKSTTTVDPLMRTIPVSRSVQSLLPIATYEDSRSIVKSQSFVALANCICRVQQGLISKSCGKPVESVYCLEHGGSITLI